jgi:hypothetical protein
LKGRCRRLTGLVLAACVAATSTPQTSEQDTTAALLARLAEMPFATHNSELRTDAIGGSDAMRIWINSNEDDTRLFTPAGGQMDIDFQIEARVWPGTLPGVVTLLVESRGSFQPGPGPRALTLRAGERSLTFVQGEHPPARSGPLVFLSVRADVPIPELLAMVTAPAVDGRIWDEPFRLLPFQLELLRAWARRVTGIDR